MIKAVLTIDDIASKNTTAIVDYLKEKDIQAIMFAWGEKVEDNYDAAIYALKQGMIVGNHSYSHPHFSELSLSEGIEEIEKNEEILEKLYKDAGVKRVYKPFRFPYGDKGGENKEALQAYLKEHGFDKVWDVDIKYDYWKEIGLDKDIDTYWTFDVAEYNLRPDNDFKKEDIWERIEAFHKEDGYQLILLHAHDETEELYPAYYKEFIDDLLLHGVTFVKPEFCGR